MQPERVFLMELDAKIGCFFVFGIEKAVFWCFCVAKARPNDAKLVQYDAKVVQNDAKLRPNDTIFCLFLPPFLTQETQKMLKTRALKLGLFFTQLLAISEQ